MQRTIEREFELIPTTSHEGLGTTLQRFCQKAVVSHHRATMVARTALDRLEIKTAAESSLLSMVILATEHCAESVIVQKKAAGLFGNPHYRQKMKRAAFERRVRCLTRQAETALGCFQQNAAKDLYSIITRHIRFTGPRDIESSEWRALAIMAYFFDIRERAEQYIEGALTIKLITKVSK